MGNSVFTYLKEDLKIHPKMKPLDVFKFIYQGTFGPNHLNIDKNVLNEHLRLEFNKTRNSKMNLIELISDKYCRVNIGAWKEKGYSFDKLFDLLYQSIQNIDTVSPNIDTVSTFFEQNIAYITNNFKEFDFDFSIEEWNLIIKSYDFTNMTPISHSCEYKSLYFPSYRVICIDLLDKI